MHNDNLLIEKRKYIRLQLQAVGQITFEDGTHYNGLIRDISIGGIFIEIPLIGQDKLNSLVVASIQVDTQGSVKSIDALCKIVRVSDDGVGLFFHVMDELCKEDFSDILREIRKGIANQ
jgi:c-di-GMP-binding flagellar brake protein YcgR